MTFTEILPIAKDVASVLSGLAAVAAFIGAFVAWRGLKSWRRQLTGRTEYELARRLCRAVYQVRQEIRIVRNPVIFPWEAMLARQEAGIEDGTPFMVGNKDIVAVYDSRWRQLVIAISNLEVESLEAEVLWGKDVIVRLKPLRDCVTKLRINLNRYIDARLDSRTWRLKLKEIEETKEIIHWHEPTEDKFSGEIADAIRNFEEFIRIYLKA
jgi:hypothetical protein